MLVVGLMSGTSLDGIDAALVRIQEEHEQMKFELLAFDSLPYPPELKERLKNLLPPREGTVQQLAYLHYYLGELFAQAALRVIEKAHLKPSDVSLIGSHGQTVCNLPRGPDVFSPRARLQIGEISVIAERTGITTVGDFRPRDVAAGGEGAPLIPFFDFHAFRSSDKHRVVLNLGGIANITYIPARAQLSDVRAFDTGPGNMLIDEIVRQLTHGARTYDQDGQMAARGKIHQGLLRFLMNHPFILREPPKSAGREEFGEGFVREIFQTSRSLNISHEDLVATVTAFTAESIAVHCERFLGPVDEVIASGGGAWNKTLLHMLGERMPKCRITTTEEYGIPIKAKEAMGFALLAYAAYRKRPNNIPSATGARRPVVLGKIVWK